MYTIDCDYANRLMRVELRGFWPNELFPVYAKELRERTQLFDPLGGCRGILVDVTNYPIQSKAVTEGHAGLLHDARDCRAVPIAMVTSSMMTRIQVGRMTKVPRDQIFPDVEAAEGWLSSRAA